MMIKIYSFNSELHRVTGVQKVLLDIHNAVNGTYQACIVGTIAYKKINTCHGIKKNEYIKWTNPFLFYRSIVFIHERKYLWIFWILNHLFFQRIKIIYIHHNIFHSLRRETILPKYIISISDNCTKNLIEYFKVNIKSIHKIYNCVKDINPKNHVSQSLNNSVTILYPAVINGIKRQTEIVNKLKGKLDKRIRILFAGTGSLYEELKQTTLGDPQFEVLGFRDDVHSLLQDCDFMMLFSKHEGLPISLIEADMCGTPIICNDVGGNIEIAHNGENAIVVNEWEDLINTLNSLPNMSKEEYRRMSLCGRKIYEEKFTFEKFKKNYLSLVETVINDE